MRLGVNALNVFGPNINWFVKNRDRIEFAYCGERGAQIVLVAFWICWSDCDVNMEARLMCRTEGGETLRGRGRLGFVDFGEIVAERRQTHAKQEPTAKSLE